MRRSSCGHSLLLGVRKPIGLSSHDVVARVRRCLGESKVGHAGTLDPLASGVLIIGAGQATRLLGLITLEDKSYLARISFGSETATDDAEGDVVRTVEVDARFADETFAANALASLVGAYEQVPPMYSAISVDGRRAYDAARKGESVELAARPVTVHDAALISVEAGDEGISWLCSFHVSKGTYIRALARDLGRSLGSAAHLSALERTASGSVGLAGCVSLDELAVGGLGCALDAPLDPTSLLPYPSCSIDEPLRADILNGKGIPVGALPHIEGAGAVCLTGEGRLWSIAELRGTRLYATSNFPQGIEGVRA